MATGLRERKLWIQASCWPGEGWAPASYSFPRQHEYCSLDQNQVMEPVNEWDTNSKICFVRYGHSKTKIHKNPFFFYPLLFLWEHFFLPNNDLMDTNILNSKKKIEAFIRALSNYLKIKILISSTYYFDLDFKFIFNLPILFIPSSWEIIS